MSNTNPTNSFNEKLFELIQFDIDQHDKDCGVTITRDYGNCDCSKQELQQAIRELILTEIVGEDEPLHIQSEFDKIDVPHLETDKYRNLDGVRQASRNLFRTHQRNKILKGDK